MTGLFRWFFCLVLLTGCDASPEQVSEPQTSAPVAAAAPARVAPNPCTKRCRKAAGAEYKVCIADGGDAVECREQAGQTARTCVAERCGGSPNTAVQPADPCRAKCAKLRLDYEPCLEDGGTEADCREETGKALNACLDAC